MLSSSSSLTTVSTLRLVIGHRGVPLGTSHIWLLRMRTPHSSTNVHLPLLFWDAKRNRGGFLPPHRPGQSLGPGGAVSVPKGSLRAGSAFFTGLLQPLCFIMKALGSWRPVLTLSICAQDTSSRRRCICFFRCVRFPDSFVGS